MLDFVRLCRGHRKTNIHANRPIPVSTALVAWPCPDVRRKAVRSATGLAMLLSHEILGKFSANFSVSSFVKSHAPLFFPSPLRQNGQAGENVTCSTSNHHPVTCFGIFAPPANLLYATQRELQHPASPSNTFVAPCPSSIEPVGRRSIATRDLLVVVSSAAVKVLRHA